MFKFKTKKVGYAFHQICINLIDTDRDINIFIRELRNIYVEKCIAENDSDGSDFSITNADLKTALNLVK